MPARLRYITSSPRRLVTLLAVTLLGFALVATAARASGVAFFGGGDAGVQAARTGVASVPVGASVTVQGVTVTITGFAADDTRTVIGLDVEGRPELGPGVMPLGQRAHSSTRTEISITKTPGRPTRPTLAS